MCTLDEILERALRCEAANRRLYLELAERFIAEPAASDFWSRLAGDEQFHVALLTSLRQQLAEEDRMRPAPATLVEAVAGVEALLAESPGDRIASLDDAYQLAHQLESQELLTAFQLVATTTLPESLRDQYLSVQIDEHLEQLPAFGAKFPAERRRRILAAPRERGC